MTEVIGVKFKEAGKTYYFDPLKKQYTVGQHVIVETARGIEYGLVTIANKMIPDEEVTGALKPVVRTATHADRKMAEANKEKEAKTFEICEEKNQKARS